MLRLPQVACRKLDPLSSLPCISGMLVMLGIVFLTPSTWGQFRLEKSDQEVVVTYQNQPVTRYVLKSGAKPILWPLHGPGGQEMTRGYPMRDAGHQEKQDHIHHRSLWFTHGDVNGVSYWHENEQHGTIRHVEFLKLADGKQAVIKTRNDWIDPSGKRACQDIRQFVFHANQHQRWIDVAIRVTATDGPVTFGDTKEGSFGIRVAGSMRVELKDGGKILTSEGQQDGDAWGKRAAWVDYSGPVAGRVRGIAIMNHPQSFRFPTYWHVRTYGLFAANPFGWHDFLRDKNADGSHRLAPGESFELFYRVVLHDGDAAAAAIAEQFQAYAADKVGWTDVDAAK